MTDEIETLKNAMKAAPAPSSTAKRDAVAAALRAFDEEFEREHQESTKPARQTLQKQPLWSRLMTTLKSNFSLRPLLMGGASVAALSLAVVVSLRDAPIGLSDIGEPAARGFGLYDLPSEDQATQGSSTSAQEQIEAEPSAPLVLLAPKAESEAMLSTRAKSGAPAMAARMESDARGGLVPLPAPEIVIHQPEARDRFANADTNPIKLVAEEPVSTFSIDVDTASYAWVRRSLREGQMPDAQSVRVEELINYFPYDYTAPSSAETPFAVSTTVMDAPWAEGRQLLHIGIRGYQPLERPRANFTFLIDTSGSMSSADKLPLLLTSFRLMLDSMRPDDTIAIVTYAGSSTVALEPTAVKDKGAILDALQSLQSGGGTAGAEGINTAYRLAESRFDAEAVNRVILATDGDFNIGPSSIEDMKAMIAQKRDSGVFLSVLGFGRGNLNDALMQSLAQQGNGQAAYIDTLAEARKALVEETASMMPIAKDVKIQIEFNPAQVQDYRLIGYETRALAREDFNNDQVDAGEIGAGHRVTAIYEITPVGAPTRIDDLRYQPPSAAVTDNSTDELAFLKLRFKAPDSDVSSLREIPITTGAAKPRKEAEFAVAVAGFGELLRGSEHLGDWSYDDVLSAAAAAMGDDRFGYRSEFLDLVRLARALDR